MYFIAHLMIFKESFKINTCYHIFISLNNRPLKSTCTPLLTLTH